MLAIILQLILVILSATAYIIYDFIVILKNKILTLHLEDI